MNKPRPIYNKDGELTGYKQEVKWRNQRRYFTRRTVAAAERAWANAIADFEAGREPYDRYRFEKAEPQETPTLAITFGEWLDEWHPKRHLGEQARKNQTSLIKARIKPDLGHLRLTNEDITQPLIQAWVWELEEEYAPRYVRTLLSTVRVALRHAVRNPEIPLSVSPVSEIQLEPLDPTGRAALTPQQVEAIVSRCGVHEKLFRSLAFSGARIGELLKRDVEDWSWRTGITIGARRIELKADNQQRPRKRKAGTRKAPASKSSAGARTIELCPSHAGEIRDYLDGRTTGAIYLGRNGRASRSAAYQKFAKASAEARAAAKKSKVDIPTGVSPHWLRHSHKTWLRDAKCDLVAIDERLGHKTEGMDGIYVHATPAMRAEILNVLEGLWRESLGLAPPDVARRVAGNS